MVNCVPRSSDSDPADAPAIMNETERRRRDRENIETALKMAGRQDLRCRRGGRPARHSADNPRVTHEIARREQTQERLSARLSTHLQACARPCYSPRLRPLNMASSSEQHSEETRHHLRRYWQNRNRSSLIELSPHRKNSEAHNETTTCHRWLDSSFRSCHSRDGDAQGGGTEAAGRKRQRYGSHRRRCGRWDGEWRRRSGWAGSNDIAARRDWSHDDDTECSAGGTAAKHEEACNFKPTLRAVTRTASLLPECSATSTISRPNAG